MYKKQYVLPLNHEQTMLNLNFLILLHFFAKFFLNVINFKIYHNFTPSNLSKLPNKVKINPVYFR